MMSTSDQEVTFSDNKTDDTRMFEIETKHPGLPARGLQLCPNVLSKEKPKPAPRTLPRSARPQDMDDRDGDPVVPDQHQQIHDPGQTLDQHTELIEDQTVRQQHDQVRQQSKQPSATVCEQNQEMLSTRLHPDQRQGKKRAPPQKQPKPLPPPVPSKKPLPVPRTLHRRQLPKAPVDDCSNVSCHLDMPTTQASQPIPLDSYPVITTSCSMTLPPATDSPITINATTTASSPIIIRSPSIVASPIRIASPTPPTVPIMIVSSTIAHSPITISLTTTPSHTAVVSSAVETIVSAAEKTLPLSPSASSLPSTTCPSSSILLPSGPHSLPTSAEMAASAVPHKELGNVEGYVEFYPVRKHKTLEIPTTTCPITKHVPPIKCVDPGNTATSHPVFIPTSTNKYEDPESPTPGSLPTIAEWRREKFRHQQKPIALQVTLSEDGSTEQWCSESSTDDPSTCTCGNKQCNTETPTGPGPIHPKYYFDGEQSSLEQQKQSLIESESGNLLECNVVSGEGHANGDKENIDSSISEKTKPKTLTRIKSPSWFRKAFSKSNKTNKEKPVPSSPPCKPKPGRLKMPESKDQGIVTKVLPEDIKSGTVKPKPPSVDGPSPSTPLSGQTQTSEDSLLNQPELISRGPDLTSGPVTSDSLVDIKSTKQTMSKPEDVEGTVSSLQSHTVLATSQINKSSEDLSSSDPTCHSTANIPTLAGGDQPDTSDDDYEEVCEQETNVTPADVPSEPIYGMGYKAPEDDEDAYVDEETIQNFFTEQRAFITSHINPSDYYNYLISKRVITGEDEETIHNTGKNRRDRAGLLLDIVSRRGPRGYNIFRLIMQYENPYVYSVVTGLTPDPGPPPPELIKWKRTSTMKALNQMLQIISKCREEEHIRSASMKRCQDVLCSFREETEQDAKKWEREYQSMSRRIRDATNDAMKWQKEFLDEKDQRLALRNECDDMRKKKKVPTATLR